MKRAEAYAPGRVELLGNHTDYNQGVVLGAAIDRGVRVTGESRDDGRIVIESTMMGRAEITPGELLPRTEQPWANYVLGVAHELNEARIPVHGFAAQIDSDVPSGSGLSSSAAFEVSTALFLLKLTGAELPPMEIARLCQRAEHKFVGVQSGLLDQVCSIFGKADQVVHFDARTEEVRVVPFPPGLALVITESGQTRELVSGLYNQRREETRAAADALGVPALRDASVAMLSSLPPLLQRRAAHIVGENERVERAVDLLGRGDGAGFGALMNESHESSRTNFENSTRELDLLVRIARELPAVLGARLTGGGFGGATVTLCRQEVGHDVAAELERRYAEQTTHKARAFVCRIAAGAV
ncbi:MAG TPA: galactokinase [Chthoniobacterales bacterium]|nr:galactokinase [Chthoniobacterales bacterium]